jgi:hypothetical protein
MTFDELWKTLPIPGEFDAMDQFDQQRWRGVIEAVFNAARESAIEDALKACSDCAAGCYDVGDGDGQAAAEQCEASVLALLAADQLRLAAARALVPAHTPTPAELLVLVSRYAEACFELGSDLSEAQTKASTRVAGAIYAELSAGLNALHAAATTAKKECANDLS